MTQATDTEIGEIKTSVDLIVKATEANTKAISDLTLEIRLGFSDIKGKLDGIDGRLVAVEGNLKGLDARLWGFGGTLLDAVLAVLPTILSRFLFSGSPIT